MNKLTGSLLTLALAAGTLSARHSSFGSSFGGTALGSFTGTTLGTAISRPREKTVVVREEAPRYREDDSHALSIARRAEDEAREARKSAEDAARGVKRLEDENRGLKGKLDETMDILKDLKRDIGDLKKRSAEAAPEA